MRFAYYAYSKDRNKAILDMDPTLVRGPCDVCEVPKVWYSWWPEKVCYNCKREHLRQGNIYRRRLDGR